MLSHCLEGPTTAHSFLKACGRWPERAGREGNPSLSHFILPAVLGNMFLFDRGGN